MFHIEKSLAIEFKNDYQQSIKMFVKINLTEWQIQIQEKNVFLQNGG